MPTKTIYVSNTDLDVFARAKAKAGTNLSSIITAALRQYVDATTMPPSEYATVQVKVGNEVTRLVHFEGRKIMGAFAPASNRFYQVYATKGNHYALVTCTLPDLAALSMSINDWAAQVLTWLDHDFSDHTYNYRLHVYASVEELRSGLPRDVAASLNRRLDQIERPAEFLDI